MATPVCKHRANPIIIKQASPTASNTQLNSRHQYYPSAPCFEQVLAESVPDPPSLKIVGKHFQIFFVGGELPNRGAHFLASTLEEGRSRLIKVAG